MPALNRRHVLAAAAALSPGWSQAQGKKSASEDIVIGQTSALTGQLSFANTEVVRGIKAHFAEFNKSGGLAGRKLKFVSLDDQYDTEKAKVNLTQLLKNENAMALISIGGTPANGALGPLIAEEKIVHVGPVTGADQLRTPVNPYVFHTRASYGGELARLAQQLGTIGQKRAVVMLSDNAFGKGATAAFTQLATAQGVTVVPVAVGEAASELDKGMAAVLAANANAFVSLYASASPNGIELVKRLRAQAVGIPTYTISLLGSPSTIAQLGNSAANMTVSQVMPFPFTARTNLIREYQAAMKQHAPGNFSHNSLEGYVNARVITWGLKRMGGAPSRERLFNALDSSRIDLGGYELDFTKGNRNGSKFTDLVIVGSNGNFLR